MGSTTIIFAVWTALAAEGYSVVYDFEAEAELNEWESEKGVELSSEHATSGANSMRVQSGDCLVNWGKRDWSRYDLFEFDAFNDTDRAAILRLVVGDRKTKKVGDETVWNTFARPFDLKPGHNTMSLPVMALSREGEEGSIDPSGIVKVEIGVTGGEGVFYFDNFRLLRATPPPGVVAIDFGPRTQPLAPGFFPADPKTPYIKGGSPGWTAPLTGGAGEAGYPGRLFGDFVRANGTEFVVDVPNGVHKLRLYFNEIGSAPGEQALYSERSVQAEGEVVFLDRRGTRETLDYLRRFERFEASPDTDVWETFVDATFRAVELSVEVKDGALNLVCRSDSPTGVQLAALVAYPAEKSGEAEAWFASTRAWARSRFMGELRYLPGKPRGRIEDIPEELRALRYLLFSRPLDEEVGVSDVPLREELLTELAGVACRGETAALRFSILPLEDKGEIRVDAGALASWNGRLGAESISVFTGVNRFVRAEGGYACRTRDLRRFDAVELKAGQVRTFFLTVKVPENAPAGEYHGRVRLWSDAGIDDEIPVSLTVYPFRLERPDFALGLEGVVPPVPEEEAQREVFARLRGSGLDGFFGAPEVELRGFDVGGKLLLDYRAVDGFLAVAREEGFASRLDGIALKGLDAKSLPVIELARPPVAEAVPPGPVGPEAVEAPAEAVEAAPAEEVGAPAEELEAPALEELKPVEPPAAPVEPPPAPGPPPEGALPPIAPEAEEEEDDLVPVEIPGLEPDGGEPEEGREKIVGEKEVSFGELVAPVFSEVLKHAASSNWPRYTVMIQPPGTPYVEYPSALERAKLIASKVPEPRLCAWVENLEFKPEPTIEQQILDAVSLVLAERMDNQAAGIARSSGKELYLYGRGLTRHSFGLLSWKALEAGLAGHIEPAYFKVCGFQYFDLDGRSSDVRVVGYGRHGLTPTVELLRMTMGVADFSYFAMLRALVERGKKSRRGRRTARKAELFLDSVADKLDIRAGRCPSWLSPDELKARAAEYIDALKTALGDYRREKKSMIKKAARPSKSG